jgi:two-component system NtrC family sensor kinase
MPSEQTPIDEFRVLESITRLQAAVIAQADLPGALQAALRDFMDLTGSELGLIGEVLHRDGRPILKAHAFELPWNDESRKFHRQFGPQGLEFTNLDNLLGHAVLTGQAVISNDPENDNRRAGTPLGHPPLHAFLGIPLTLQSERIGMIGLANRPGGYDERHIRLLQPMAVTLAHIIHARRLAEQRSRMEAVLTASLDALGDGVILWDSDERLAHANAKVLEDFSGAGGRIVRGMHAREFFELVWDIGMISPGFPGDRETFIDQRLDRFRNPAGPMEWEVPGGRWILNRDIRLADGHTLSLGTDITPFKQREWELIQARQRAEQANRSKSEFLATMSHELRTPLNAVIGFSDIIANRAFGENDPRYYDYAHDINASGRHLLSLIEDLLEMARLDAGRQTLHRETVDPAGLVEEAVTVVRQMAADKQIRLDNRVGDVGELFADARAFRQIVINLLTNAVKYSPENTTVSIDADRRTDGLHMAVADQGIGIPEDMLEAVFEPFRQVESHKARQHNGVGLGLAISRRLMQMHGGAIGLDSKPGQGTRAWLFFPAGQPTVEADRQ